MKTASFINVALQTQYNNLHDTGPYSIISPEDNAQSPTAWIRIIHEHSTFASPSSVLYLTN